MMATDAAAAGADAPSTALRDKTNTQHSAIGMQTPAAKATLAQQSSQRAHTMDDNSAAAGALPIAGEPVIDMRSDSYTRPDPSIWAAVHTAAVAPEFPASNPKTLDDPETLRLEARVAALCGHEAALFTTSATLCNVIAQVVHCGRDGEVLVGSVNHTALFSDSEVLELPQTLLPLEPDGTIALDAVAAAVRGSGRNKPDPTPAATDATKTKERKRTTSMLSVEDTHSRLAGLPLPLSYPRQARELADRLAGEGLDLRLHCDGARVWHAAAVHKVPLRKITAHYDSVSLCFCKALGAPMGAALVGSAEFIAKARRVRRVYGGALWQSGYFAAMCSAGLDRRLHTLQEDHAKGALLAALIQGEAPPARYEGVVLTTETAASQCAASVADTGDSLEGSTHAAPRSQHSRAGLPNGVTEVAWGGTNVVIVEVASVEIRDAILKGLAERGVLAGFMCALGGRAAAPACIRLIPTANHSLEDVHRAGVLLRGLLEAMATEDAAT